jgi:magnesium-transporting ATPase (P-type)
MRMVKVTEMTVDNSQLTGEGDPQKRQVTADTPAVLEAENLAFMGTTVVAGAGVGLIIRRGDASVLGKISTLAGASKDDMQRQEPVCPVVLSRLLTDLGFLSEYRSIAPALFPHTNSMSHNDTKEMLLVAIRQGQSPADSNATSTFSHFAWGPAAACAA